MEINEYWLKFNSNDFLPVHVGLLDLHFKYFNSVLKHFSTDQPAKLHYSYLKKTKQHTLIMGLYHMTDYGMTMDIHTCGTVKK